MTTGQSPEAPRDKSGDPLGPKNPDKAAKKQAKAAVHRAYKKPKRTVARGAEYYAYLRSDAWKAVKARYMQSKLKKECFCCRLPWAPGFEFHHKTYANLGAERLTDLALVCRPCHQRVHARHKMGDVSLWKATHRVRRSFTRKIRAAKKEAVKKRADEQRAAHRLKMAQAQTPVSKRRTPKNSTHSPLNRHAIPTTTIAPRSNHQDY